MKSAFAFVLVGATALFSQQAVTKNTCSQYETPAWRNYEEYGYQKSVLRLVHPPDRSMITLSVFVTGNLPKIYMRMKAPGAFELVRALRSDGIGPFIARLEASCELPVSPLEASRLLDIQWERVPISESQFQAIYADFTKAMSQYTKNLATRPAKAGDRITLHAQEFSVSYETTGFENFEITAVDSQDSTGSPDDTMAKWAVSFVREATTLLERHK